MMKTIQKIIGVILGLFVAFWLIGSFWNFSDTTTINGQKVHVEYHNNGITSYKTYSKE